MKTNLLLITLATSSLLLSACTTTEVTSSTSSTVDAVTPDVTLNRFVDVRIASIQQEAAKGEGENLDALAHMMGKADSARFSSWMQTHYDELFTGLNAPTELIARIEQVATRSAI
jgi:hypothetical protein